jgi:hypothetical protein
MTVGYLRRLILALIAGAAILVVWIATTIAVGAAGADNDATICINYSTCYDSNTGILVSNPNPIPAPTTYTAPVYAPVPVAYSPTTGTSATGYPPNTVISTYFDPRYGVVSVVTDGSGNLIDINAATGQRIYPFYPDYGYGYGYGYGYTNGVNGLYSGNVYNAYSPWGYGVWYGGYGANYCGTGVYAPACPTNVPNLQPPTQTNIVVGTKIVPVAVKSAGPAVQVPAADPQPAPAPAPVAAPAQAPQPAPAQTITSMAAAQQPAAPATAPVAVPTSGGANGTTVQGSSTAVVAAPSNAVSDDHRG